MPPTATPAPDIPPALLCAGALVDGLINQGVTDFVLSPGSRSAPLALVLAEREVQQHIRLHVRIDERSAGFFAVGLSRADRGPVAVVCTSGTAVANLWPAVVEANHSGLPLVMLTADRPAELRSVGAPQTINQVGIFADNVRWTADLATPSGATTEQMDWAAAAQSAVRYAQNGPVHLNLPFRPPLVGLVPPVPGSATKAATASSGSESRPAETAEPAVTLPSSGISRGVILVGDLPLAAEQNAQVWRDIGRISAKLHWPIVAEPTANPAVSDNLIQHGPLILGSERFLTEHRPDFVLSVGRFGLSRPVMALARAAGSLWAVNIGGRPGPVDPALSATRQLTAIPDLPEQPDTSIDDADPDRNSPPGLTASPPASDWLADWLAADHRAAAVLESWWSTAEGNDGAQATRVAWPDAASGEDVFVAASWPIRFVDSFVSSLPEVRVVANRGANGIDGLISTAFGYAVGLRPGAESRRGTQRSSRASSVLAIMGDIAFLHDVGALSQIPADLALTILVLDNNGGGIFSQLEQGQPHYARDFDRVFGTPTHQDLGAVATGFGAPAVTIDSVTELADALAQARSAGGCNVIVLRTASRVAEAEQLTAITKAVQATLG